MARISPVAADSIILYLFTQGYKAGGARPLGPDIIEYLTRKGHTFHPRAEKKLRDMPSAGWSGLLKKWTANNSLVSSVFGLSAYEVDSLYTKNLPTGRDIVLGSSPHGSPSGGKGRAAKSNRYNQTGWDNINLESIAMTGKPDPAYLALLQELKAGKTVSDLFDTVYTRYEVGSGLERYAASPPTVGGATPVTPSTPAKEEEEEEVEEEEEPEAIMIWEDFADKLSLTDVTLFLEEGDDVPEIEISDRKISSKAYNLTPNGAFEVTKGKIILRMKKLKAEKIGFDMDAGFIAIGKYDEFEEMFSKGTGVKVEILDDDEEPMEVVDAPEVVFIVDASDKTVSIGINGKVVPATSGEGTPYTFTKAEIVVEDPTTGDKIREVLLDGSPMTFGKREGVINEYGLPVRGIEGLPENCYESHYEEGEGKAGEDSKTLAMIERGKYYEEGGRSVKFGKVNTIEYNIEDLGEKTLQPLALEFDTTLDLEKEGVYFLLIMGPLDGSNLFPGFDINSSVDANQEAIFFPNDVRNLRPINEDGLVMLQKLKARRAGEGIESIETASSNLQGSAEVTLGDSTYDAEVYTQVLITFEDGEQLLVPDGDERFKALDNSDSEIKGVVSVDEATEKPQMMVIKGDGQEIYESLEKGRRSARLSNRFNRKDKDQKINTQTAMIQQGDSYYIIMGVGGQTVLVEMDMSRED